MAKRAWMTSLYLSHSGFTKPPAPSGSESPKGSAMDQVFAQSILFGKKDTADLNYDPEGNLQDVKT